MSVPRGRWLTARQTAAVLNITSAEVCRLLSLGRLTGKKQKQPGFPGKGQWRIDARSVAGEKRRIASRKVRRAARTPGTGRARPSRS